MIMIRDIEELKSFLFDQSSLSLSLNSRGSSKRSAAKPLDPKAPSPPGRIACPPKKFAAFVVFCLRENKIEKNS